MRLVKSSSTEVSGPSKVPRFVGKLMFIGSQAGLLVLDNRVDRVLARQLSTSES